MIKQTAIGLQSRSLANPYNNEGFLPLITAPMYSVVNEDNYEVFLNNKIQVCLPRGSYLADTPDLNDVFRSVSLEEFKKMFLDTDDGFFDVYDEMGNANVIMCPKICIDTANGNIPTLHDYIRQAKQKYPHSLVIMAGNVSSVEAFVELAKTGVDYIRVGIGGGGGCNTTSNTGVGQEDLEKLIVSCKYHMKHHPTMGGQISMTSTEMINVKNVKIVADGISSYIKQCGSKYGFNDNGYAAINKLLLAGADLCMIGKLFAQCAESAGEKRWRSFKDDIGEVVNNDFVKSHFHIHHNSDDRVKTTWVKYSGMSTQLEQVKYKGDFNHNNYTLNLNWNGLAAPARIENNIVYEDWGDAREEKSYLLSEVIDLLEWWKIGDIEECIKYKNTIQLKPSEGSVQWIPVRWTLKEWLHGSQNQDSYPYLMGWVNSIKSAMAYTNQIKL